MKLFEHRSVARQRPGAGTSDSDVLERIDGTARGPAEVLA